jgi:acyl-coenzyme A synthetase/AMP-(fatty) acid ligase
VVSFDDAIEAYLVLADGTELSSVQAALGEELAAYKRPRRIYVMSELPRTATGKNVRDRAVLRTAAEATPATAT